MIIVLASLISIFTVFPWGGSNLVVALFVGASSIILAQDFVETVKIAIASWLGKICFSCLAGILLIRTLFSESFSTPHFFFELTAILSLILGGAALRQTYYKSGPKKVLSDITIATTLSIFIFAIGFFRDGLSFSSVDVGRVYSSESDLSLKNILTISVFSFPFFRLGSRPQAKFILSLGMILFSIASLASGGRSFLPLLVYLVLVLLPLIEKRSISVYALAYASSLILVLLIFKSSLEFVYARLLAGNVASQLESSYGMDSRFLEFVIYISNSTSLATFLGLGMGSVTSSILFDGITNTLHLSIGTLVLKVGWLGLLFVVLWISSFVAALIKAKSPVSLVMALPLLGWFLSLDLPHTTLSSPQIMFYLGYFMAFAFYSVALTSRANSSIVPA